MGRFCVPSSCAWSVAGETGGPFHTIVRRPSFCNHSRFPSLAASTFNQRSVVPLLCLNHRVLSHPDLKKFLSQCPCKILAFKPGFGAEFLQAMKLDKRVPGSINQPDLSSGRMNLIFGDKVFVHV